MDNMFPVFLDLTARKCLVIGGGIVAERKVKSLLQCRADVHLVSPDLTSYLLDLVEQGRIIYSKRQFLVKDMENAFLVISAAGDKDINNLLVLESQKSSFLLNIVDEPEKGNFFVPSLVKRGKLKIAISTSGASPLLARRLRERLEKEFGPEYERFLDILEEVRKNVKVRYDDPKKRLAIYESLVNSDIPELLKIGNEAKVKERINQCLS